MTTLRAAFGLPRHTISVDIHADAQSVPTITVKHYDSDAAGRIITNDGLMQIIESTFALIPMEIFISLPPDVVELIRRGGDATA